MKRKVLILDTSVLCCWLKVTGKDKAGPQNNLWDYKRIKSLLDHERQQGSVFVLPMAALIETGNHIAQATTNRYDCAKRLAKHLYDAADAATPWAAFTEQSSLWDSTNLQKLADYWPDLAAAGTSIGDATIKDVAEYYASAGFVVEILTGDSGLKAYQPAIPTPIPRRRQ